MYRKALCIFVCVAATCSLLPAVASAHFVWIRIDDSGEATTSHLFFSEAGNVDGDRMPDSIQDATAVIQSAGSEPTPLALEFTKDGDFVSKHAETTGTETFSVSTDCQYGLYHGSLLQYHAKAIHVANPSALSEVNASKSARLDIVPTVLAGKLIVGISWDGQPLGDTTVKITDPDGKDHKLTTDAQGSLEFEGIQEGLYSIMANRADKSAKGTIDGEDYKSASYYSTLTIRIPASLAGGEAGKVSRVEIDSAYPLLPIGISSFGAAVNGDWL